MNWTQTINSLIQMTAQASVTVGPGGNQQKLDRIASSLNEIAAQVALQDNLRRILNNEPPPPPEATPPPPLPESPALRNGVPTNIYPNAALENVLDCIRTYPGCTAVDIAYACGTRSRSNITTKARQLLEAGLITRHAQAGNAGTLRHYPTATEQLQKHTGDKP